MKFTPAGDMQWTTQAGPAGPDEGHAIAYDGAGHLYTAGNVFRGSVFTPFDDDVFTAKISLVPEPTSVPLLVAALACFVTSRRNRVRL
jgi:hypothetical protein